jgi:capsular polysaccharide biosynthesis protein
MELKEAIKIINNKIKIIAAISIITAMSAYIFSFIQPAVYETSLSLLIGKEGTQETDDFKYDGYYALQTSEILADSIQQWMKSPETVDEIYKEAGVDREFESIKSYSKKFTAKKMSPQYAEIKFKASERDEAEKISSAIVKVINNKTRKIQENSNEEISFKVESGSPVILETRPNILINSIIGLISGSVLGLFFVFTKEYFKQ